MTTPPAALQLLLPGAQVWLELAPALLCIVSPVEHVSGKLEDRDLANRPRACTAQLSWFGAQFGDVLAGVSSSAAAHFDFRAVRGRFG